jgi:hypothetical protein
MRNDRQFPILGTSSRNKERNEVEHYTELRWNVVSKTEERMLGLMTWPSMCSAAALVVHSSCRHLGRPRAAPPPWVSTCSTATLGVHTQHRHHCPHVEPPLPPMRTLNSRGEEEAMGVGLGRGRGGVAVWCIAVLRQEQEAKMRCEIMEGEAKRIWLC